MRMRRAFALLLIVSLSNDAASAHRLLPLIPHSNANTVALIRHFAAVPILADQNSINAYYNCIASLPALSLMWVNGYTQDAATWNWANVNAPRIAFHNGSWNSAAGGWRGDGSSIYGST